jgi:SAM-dependent methyltransferase
MNYTGERMQPEASDRSTFWEHLYRYAFAARYAPARRVLDVACGTGYGSAALREAGAENVVGIDASAEACEFAIRKYGIDARIGDAESLALGSASFDLVVSFETIEHLANPRRFLDECHRVLRPGGVAIVSTPHKTNYREITPHNPFHFHEFEPDEFVRECRQRFAQTNFFTQRPFRAPWWSPRGMAAMFWPWLALPGAYRNRENFIRRLYPQFTAEGLANARAQPIETIVTLSRETRTFANPYAVRPGDGNAADRPIYLLAVVTKAR